MKKYFTRFLCMVLCLCTIGFQFASAAPVNPDEDYGIMPLADLYSDTFSTQNSSWRSNNFSATSGNGKYIRYWFRNDTSRTCTFLLYGAGASGKLNIVGRMSVDGNSSKSGVYNATESDTSIYHIVIEATQQGGSIAGEVSVSQYEQSGLI